MRVLTVRQPWAWSIIHGGKDVENRVRNIAGSYRGPVAIHAGLQFADMPTGMPFEVAVAIGKWRRANPNAPGRDLPDDPRNARPIWYGHLGHVIGVVDLTSVHHDGDHGCAWPCSPWALPNDWHLRVENPLPLAQPIPAKGRLGLWKPDATLEAAIREQVAA